MKGCHSGRWAGLAAALVVTAVVLHPAEPRTGPGPDEPAVETGQVLGSHAEDPNRHPVCGALEPTGRRVAFGDRSGAVEVWEAGGRQPLWRWQAHAAHATAAAFLPDAGVLLTAGRDNVLRSWTLTPDGPAVRSEDPTPGAVLSLAVAPDGRTVAAGMGGRVVVWRVGESGRTPAAEVAVPGLPTLTLAFSPDGSQLAFAAHSNRVRVWRPGSPDEPAVVALSPANQVRGLAFTPDGRGLVVLDTEGRLFRTDLDTGGRRDWHLPGPLYKSARFAPDLRRVLTVHQNGTARLAALPDGITDP